MTAVWWGLVGVTAVAAMGGLLGAVLGGLMQLFIKRPIFRILIAAPLIGVAISLSMLGLKFALTMDAIPKAAKESLLYGSFLAFGVSIFSTVVFLKARIKRIEKA